MGVWWLQALERERSCVKVSYPGGLLFSNLRYAAREKKNSKHWHCNHLSPAVMRNKRILFEDSPLSISSWLPPVIFSCRNNKFGRSHCENKYCYISKYIHCSFIYRHFCPFSRRKYRFYICYLWFPHSHFFFLSSREWKETWNNIKENAYKILFSCKKNSN